MPGMRHEPRPALGAELRAIFGLLLLAVLSPASTAAAPEEPHQPSAGALLDQAFRNLYDADFVQVLRMTSRSRTGRELSRRLQITRKQTGGPGRALVRFLDPPDLRGTSLLVFQKTGRHDDVFLYLPAFERTRRISSAQRSDAFFGSDFTYEDLEPKQASDYAASTLGHEGAEGRLVVLIEVRARGVASQYERAIHAIDPQRKVVIRTDYYRNGSLCKRLEVDPAQIREVDGRHLPFRARMSSLRRGTETVIETESYELHSAIPDSIFTETNLAVGDPERDRSRSDPR